MSHCSGCNKSLNIDEPVVEIARSEVYCLALCAMPTTVSDLLCLATR